MTNQPDALTPDRLVGMSALVARNARRHSQAQADRIAELEAALRDAAQAVHMYACGYETLLRGQRATGRFEECKADYCVRRRRLLAQENS